MGQIRLEDIQDIVKVKKTKYILKAILLELFRFSLFFVTVFIIVVVFINFNLFYALFKEKFFGDVSMASDVGYHKPITTNSKQNAQFSTDNFENLKKQAYLKELNKKLSTISTAQKNDSFYEKNLKVYLKNKLNGYNFNFNLTPPDKRLEIKDIGVSAPVVDLNYISSEKLKNADYDQELFHGVVKYPYTPNPNQTGAMLIFGHTSYYWWKKNPYGEIFAKLPVLKNGQKIKLYWQGKEYNYEVIGKEIVYPNNVSQVYEEYANDGGRYLILMGCYPVGTTSQRILIISKFTN